MSYNPYNNWSNGNYYNYRDRKEKGGQASGGGGGGYNQGDNHPYYYDRNGGSSSGGGGGGGGYNSSYPANYSESKSSRDYYNYPPGGAFEYDRRRGSATMNTNDLHPPRSGGGSNYRSNSYHDARGFNSAPSGGGGGGKGANYPPSSYFHYNNSNHNSSAYYNMPYAGGGGSYYGGYSNSSSSNQYNQGNNYSAANGQQQFNGKGDRSTRPPPSLSDSPTKSRQYSFGAKRGKRSMMATRLDMSTKENNNNKDKVVKEEKEPEKEVIKDPAIEQMVKFTSSVIDSKINLLLLSLNLKLAEVKEVAKPVTVAPAVVAAPVCQEKPANKLEVPPKQLSKFEGKEELPPLKPTPLKRSASNMSDTNMSAKKQKLQDLQQDQQAREKQEQYPSHPRNKYQERSVTPKSFPPEETMRKREMSHEKNPRSPPLLEDSRSGKKGPPSGRDSRGRGPSTETPSSSSRNPSTTVAGDPYYQDYQGKQPYGQQYGYDYYQQREWNYESYNASFDRAATNPTATASADRAYNYSAYDYNQSTYDYRSAQQPTDYPYQGGRGKPERVERPDSRNSGGKYPEYREGGGYRQAAENREAWSTPADKGGRNNDNNFHSGRGNNGPHTGSQQKRDKPHFQPSLRTPR